MLFKFSRISGKSDSGIAFPEYFLIQTVSRCNANCLICPYGNTVHDQKQGRMEMDLFKGIIDNAAQFRDRVKQIMPYLMNEPLLDRTLVDKIIYIHKKVPNAKIHLVTNGTLLEKGLADRLLQSPINSIKISMLGHREATFKKTMGLRDYHKIFPRIVDFAEKAVRLKGYDAVSICFTNTPGMVSKSEIDEAARFWEKKGVRYEIINHPISRAGNAALLKPPRHTAISGCKSIWRNEMIHILFNGDVVLCCMDWRREVVLGNIKKHTIEQIWNSGKYHKIREIIRGQASGSPDFLCYRCEEAISKK